MGNISFQIRFDRFKISERNSCEFQFKSLDTRVFDLFEDDLKVIWKYDVKIEIINVKVLNFEYHQFKIS